MRVRASILLPATALAALALTQFAAPSPDDEALGAPSQAVLASSSFKTKAALPVVATRRAGPRPDRLAVLRHGVALAATPGGPRAIQVGAETEFGSPRVLAVAAQRGDWLGLVTSERPNNELAWVRRGNLSLTLRRTRFSLHVDLSAHTLTLRRGGRRVHRMSVAVGRPGSDTPTGRFAVTDKLPGSRFGPYYGCCILALTGHQPNLPSGWTGGDRLAIHGTDAPSSIGAASSAGCLRASDEDLRVLMATVPLGTQVSIHR
ncbi:MAG: L,D-transpeptidase [Thermoleophilaceae bacterium]